MMEMLSRTSDQTVSAAGSRAPLLSVRDLSIEIPLPGRIARLVRSVSFDVSAGEIVGMVGESGSGKTLTGLAIVGLLPERARVSGQILLEGDDVVRAGERVMRRHRGATVGMVFQEPRSALNPVLTIGNQLAETLRTHERLSKRAAAARALELLRRVEVPDPQRVSNSYVHQLSGGLAQRCMIAIALSCNPRLIIADEPTTALDVTIQAQILQLLVDAARETSAAVMLVTHDLGVVGEACDRVLTMYAGEIVETGPVDEVVTRPLHPYTEGLLLAMPRLEDRRDVLPSIPGIVPEVTSHFVRCAFSPRCRYATAECVASAPALEAVGDGTRSVRCFRHEEFELAGVGE